MPTMTRLTPTGVSSSGAVTTAIPDDAVTITLSDKSRSMSTGDVSLFQGFDTFAGSVRSTALTGEEGVSNARFSCTYQLCETFEDFASFIEVSGSASYSSLFASGDAKATWMHSLNLSKHSLVFAIRAERSETKTYKTASIRKKPTSAVSFFSSYGDSFVSKVTFGAEYIATYVFSSQSEEQHQSVSASLKANFKVGLGTVNADLAMKMTESIAKSSVQVRSAQYVAGLTPELPNGVDAMVRFALNLGTAPVIEPATLAYVTTGYESVDGAPKDFGKIRLTRNLFANRRDGVAALWQRLELVDKEIGGIKEIYKAYDYAADEDLDRRRALLGKDRKALRAFIERMSVDPTKHCEIPARSHDWDTTPVIQYRTHESETLGDRGSVEFKDLSDLSVVQRRRRLTQLQARYGSLIDQITATYTDADGNVEVKPHGSETGPFDQPLLQLGPGEFITRVAGVRIEGHLRQLRVWTSHQSGDGGWAVEWTQGGTLVGESFDHMVKEGEVVVALAGTTDRNSPTYLTSIKLITLVFSPATWSAN